MVARKPVHQGEHDISRKAIAQGRPGVLRWTCMLVCILFCANRTRDRGCSAHPVFPAPSVFEGKEFLAKLGRIVSRERELVFGGRHCLRQTRSVCARERSDAAIHSFFARPDGLLRFARNDERRYGSNINTIAPALTTQCSHHQHSMALRLRMA